MGFLTYCIQEIKQKHSQNKTVNWQKPFGITFQETRFEMLDFTMKGFGYYYQCVCVITYQQQVVFAIVWPSSMVEQAQRSNRTICKNTVWCLYVILMYSNKFLVRKSFLSFLVTIHSSSHQTKHNTSMVLQTIGTSVRPKPKLRPFLTESFRPKLRWRLPKYRIGKKRRFGSFWRIFQNISYCFFQFHSKINQNPN